MSSLCLGLAFSLALARVPAQQFTLAWTHSVEKVVWEEDYQIDDDRLLLTEARVRGSGAGMEPPSGAQLINGVWHYRPSLSPLPKLTLTRSHYAGDYQLCWMADCQNLTKLLGPPFAEGEVVDLFPCSRLIG